ncbi:unnamed protein product [Amoebophrya sp. A120]|nr:unnamed protein product [Amoebophrya sp. A120]|eukprot:GSA120T00017499001.1
MVVPPYIPFKTFLLSSFFLLLLQLCLLHTQASAVAPPEDQCDFDRGDAGFRLPVADAASPSTLHLLRCYEEMGQNFDHLLGVSEQDEDGRSSGEDNWDQHVETCCPFPKLYELSLWVESSVEHEREMLKKPLPQINTKGHMCERAIRNSFDVLLHAGDEFRKLIREALPLMAELARELSCQRCVPGYTQFLKQHKQRSGLPMFFKLVHSMESGLLNLAHTLYNPAETEVPSTDGDFICPTYTQPVSGLLRKLDASGVVGGRPDAIAAYHEGHDQIARLHDTQLAAYPEGLQQVLEGFVTALSYPYSVVTQEVFLRNLGWEKMLRGQIDEDHRMWGNVVHEKSRLYGNWRTSAAAAAHLDQSGFPVVFKDQGIIDDGRVRPVVEHDQVRAQCSSVPSGGGKSAPRGEGDQDVAEGLFVLISNRTSDALVDKLAGEMFQESRPTLILEEVVGDGMEALGRDCHGTAESRFCLRPMHASGLKSLLRDKTNVQVVWKRHANSFHLADEDSLLNAKTKRKPAGTVRQQVVQQLLLDRFAADPSQSLEQHASAALGHQQVIATPLLRGYFDHQMGSRGNFVDTLRVVDLRAPDFQRLVGGFAAAHEDHNHDEQHPGHHTAWADTFLPGTGVKSPAFCKPGLPLPTQAELDRYAEWHAENPAGAKRLVVVCLPFSQCGGHGDRVNGLLTLFLLALITKRRFLILSSNPVDWHSVFAPNRIDWRTEIGQISLTNVRTYFDKRYGFREDLDRILASPAQTLLLRVNNRIVKSLYGEGCDLQAPFLVSRVMQFLFSPNIYLEQTINETAEELGLFAPQYNSGSTSSGTTTSGEPRPAAVKTSTDNMENLLVPYISIHYRTGDIAFDPHRHNSSLAGFVQCAYQIERELGLPPETPWVLHADSLRQVPESWYLAAAEKYEDFLNEQEKEKQQFLIDQRQEERQAAQEIDAKLLAKDAPLLPPPLASSLPAKGVGAHGAVPAAEDFARRKLRVPRGLGRVHIDRSEFQPGVKGFQNAFAEWYLVSQARAVLLSRSFFAETAAEIGRIRDAYFITGCVKMDLSSS